MAFGLTPKYLFDITINDLTQEEILVTSLEAVKKLDWALGFSSESGLMAYTGMSLSSYGEEISIQIVGQTLSLKSSCTGMQLADWGRNRKNIERFLETFASLKGTINAEVVAARMAELRNEWSARQDKPNLLNPKSKGVLSIFVPSSGFFVTPIVVDINILVFVLMVTLGGVNIMLPETQSLIDWGANFRPMTLDGEPWRLITCCFIHIGIFHLLMNLYALVYIGMQLEPLLGTKRFAVAYLLSGIGGSALSLYWHELTVSAGASGAIFGLYGVFLAMLTTNLIEKTARRQLLTSIAIFVGYNLLNGLKGGIDNAGHIGGLVSGLVIGYAMHPGLVRPTEPRITNMALVLLTAFIGSTVFFVYSQTPNDIGMYEKKMSVFVELEKKAMEVYQKAGTTSNEELLALISEGGLKSWQQSIDVISDADQLQLPEELHDRNKKLIEYCELRIRSYELLYKAIQEDSDAYKDEIAAYNERISSLIEELGGEKN